MPKLFNGTRNKATWFLVAGLVLAIPTYAQQSETAEHYVNRLIKEAIGAQPLQESRSPRQREIENAFRTQFRTMIQQNRDLIAALNKVDQEKIKKLMSPESMADPAIGSDAVKELDAYSALEQEHGVKADQSITDLRHTFEAMNWTPLQREQALKSFDAIMAAPQNSRHRYLETAKAWVGSVDDLYRYTSEHKTAFKVENGNLQVFDDKVLAELNQKIRATNVFREEMLKAEQDYKDLQSQRMKASGIDAKTVGMQ